MEHAGNHRAAAIRRVLWITLMCNAVVSLAKISYGYYSHSVAITADGYHSMFDGISNIVGFIGIHMASHPPDKEHPYGHRKYETIFTIFIGIMMSLTCIEIFKQVYLSFTSGQHVTITPAAFAIMLITMGVNIFVATYEKREGSRLNSEFLIADSMHTRTDIYTTAGVIIGLVLIRLGYPMADAAVGALVGLIVARAGIRILMDSAEVLADRNQLDTNIISELVCSMNGVMDCHGIRSRGTRTHVFVDLHMLVKPDLTVQAAHRLAHQAEEHIKERFKQVADVVVHIEPYLKPSGD